ncbi:hypothetical protein N2152v2_010981 [Parachlorella kessleri]
MPSLPELACERSGVTADKAFAIDDEDAKLYDKLGQDTFVKLSTEFYNRVYDDSEPVDAGGSQPVPFNSIFSKFTKESAIRNQYEFVIQRLGGPPLYSQRKGHPALMARHSQLPCTEASAERYMVHMGEALKAVPEIDGDAAERLYNYFRHTCFFLAVGQEVMQQRRVQWPPQQQGQHQQQAQAAEQMGQ